MSPLSRDFTLTNAGEGGDLLLIQRLRELGWASQSFLSYQSLSPRTSLLLGAAGCAINVIDIT